MADEITPNPQIPSTNTADRQTEPQDQSISEPVEATIPSEPEIQAVDIG